MRTFWNDYKNVVKMYAALNVGYYLFMSLSVYMGWWPVYAMAYNAATMNPVWVMELFPQFAMFFTALFAGDEIFG